MFMAPDWPQQPGRPQLRAETTRDRLRNSEDSAIQKCNSEKHGNETPNQMASSVVRKQEPKRNSEVNALKDPYSRRQTLLW